MRVRWAALACVLACQRTPEPEFPQRPSPPVQPQAEAIDDPEPPTTAQPPGVALPQPATDFFDFADGRPRTGDYLIWRRPDDFEPDTTVWLSVQATSTEWIGQRDGLWIAARDVIWHWQPTHTDLTVCAPLACEEEVPRCKPMARTSAGTVDEAAWQDLLTDRSVPVGPRLPSVAATGLGAKSLHETWLPLAVVNGTLVLRIETHWGLCDGGSGGRVQVKTVVPPMPTMRPLFKSTTNLPPELRALGGTSPPVWGGIHQGIDSEGRWHIHEEWLVPLPNEVSEVSAEALYTHTRLPAERLPGSLASEARESPLLQRAAMAKGATEADVPSWGWSRLHATGERRETLRRAFAGEDVPVERK